MHSTNNVIVPFLYSHFCLPFSFTEFSSYVGKGILILERILLYTTLHVLLACIINEDSGGDALLLII